MIGVVTIALIGTSNAGDTPFEKLLGHNTHILDSWLNLEKAFRDYGRLNKDLKEEIKKLLKSKIEGTPQSFPGESYSAFVNKKSSLARAFALLIAEDNAEIDGHVIEMMKEYFSDEEISELCAYICFIIATQKISTALKL